MWDDELEAVRAVTWDDWRDRLPPDDMRFLENTATAIAMLAQDGRARARFRDGLTQFASQYAAFRTAHEAWKAKTWREEMGTPTNPLGAIWPGTYGTGWKRPEDFRPPGFTGIWVPVQLWRAIEKDVPKVLGDYALLTAIHDKILPGTPINDGCLPDDLFRKIWCNLLNNVDGEGGRPDRPPRYAVNRRQVEDALERVRQDVKPKPGPTSPGNLDPKPNAPRRKAGGTAEKGTGKAKRETKKVSMKDRFTFELGRAFFNRKDLGLPSDAPITVLKKLTDNFGHVVPYKDFDPNYSSAVPGTLPNTVTKIRKSFVMHQVPCEIKSKSGKGYLIREITRPNRRKKRVRIKP